MLELARNIKETCRNAVIISGPARSGTTVMGKILHSMEDVEYVYEPPTILSLIASIGSMQENTWRLLYETYLYEEFLMNALAGRNLNFNKFEESSVYNVKDRDLINRRLARPHRKNGLEKIAAKSRIVYKIPDITFYIPKIQNYYPDTKVIVMLRPANDVLYSIKQKGWLTDESLKFSNQLWPNYIFNDFRVPYWVKEEDINEFIGLDEIHRIAYYYLRVNEGLEKIKNCILLEYERLVADPEQTVTEVSKKLDLKFGPKTGEIIKEVKSRRHEDKGDLLKLVNPQMRQRILRIFYASI